MKTTLAFVALVATSSSSPALVQRAAAPTVTINSGVVIGQTNVLLKQDRFLGIPYAAPPVGNLRLRAPQSLTSTFGTLTATTSPSACPQLKESTSLPATVTSAGQIATGTPNVFSLLGPQANSSEDCLYLNVQRPSGTNATSKLPVLAWIYGGGFQARMNAPAANGRFSFDCDTNLITGSTAFYDGYLMLSKAMSFDLPYVFVAMNYRGAAFGFLGGEQLSQEGNTNLGLRDQRAALEWIADNIQAFGGDPTKVTIWGESAGSWSVMDQTIINGGSNLYNGKPLFRGAMMNSGATFPALEVTHPKPQGIFNGLATSAGCDPNSSTVLQCLRSVDYNTFLTAQNDQVLPNFPASLTYLARPDPASAFFSLSPEAAVAAGKFAKVPIICGNQQDEGASFALLLHGINGSSDQNLLEVFEPVFPEAPAASLQTFFDTYPLSPSAGTPYNTGNANVIYPGSKRLGAIIGDAVFILARRLYLNAVSSSVKAWSFISTYDSGTPIVGTCHGTDVLAMWRGVTFKPGVAVNQMFTRYISFINYLDPNVLATAQGLDAWPQYTTTSRQLLSFNQQNVSFLTDNFRASSYASLQANDSYFRM